MPFKTFNTGPTSWHELRKFGMPPRSVIRNNAAASYANGQTIAGLGPATGQRIYIEGVTIFSNVDCVVDVFINGGVDKLEYTSIGPRIELSAGHRTVTVPIFDILYDGMTVGIVAVGTITNAQISFCISSGVVTASDANFNASKHWMFVGDSNTNTTILNAQRNDNYYHAHLANAAMDAGNPSVLRILKGTGGAKSTNADWYRDTGLLNVDKLDMFAYMMGTNDSGGLAQFQPVFERMITHRNRYYPKAKFLILGAPYRGDGGGGGQETNLIAIRQYLQEIQPDIPNSLYYDMSNPDVVEHNSTMSPDGVHFIGAAHQAWGTDLYNTLKTAGWLK